VAFKDLGDWVELGGLKLPISGKVYVLPPVSAELGPRLQVLMSSGVRLGQGERLADDDKQVLSDLAEKELYRDLLGPAYDEMIADGVSWPALKHAAMTVLVDATVDRDTAEQYWENLGKPPAVKKAAVKKPADRLPPKDPKVTEIRTRRASTAGTTSRRPPAARASRGKPSSNTGS
jgi:hypothetical protein